MFTQKSLAAAAAIALLPVGAFAGEFSATAGFEASVDFDSDFDSTGDAVELSLGGEYTAGGFFAGLTFTFAEAGGVDELETELALGYGGDITDKTSYEVALYGYWYDDSGYDTTEAELVLSQAFSDTVSGSYTYTYDIESEDDYHEVALEVAVGDRTVEPVLGTDGDVTAWELNFGYGFEGGVGLSIEFSDDDSAGSDLTTSIVFDYELDLLS